MARMLDDAVRIIILGLLGLALLAAVIWYGRFLYQELSGTGEVVIDPFTVIRDSGKGDSDVGPALAQMLQARLQSLARELRDAQTGLTTSVSASAIATTRVVSPVGDVRLWSQTVALQTTLLQPVDMKLSVAGVDVGGVIPWIQRGLTNRRTVHFTIYLRGDEAQISGSIRALQLSDDALRMTVKGAGGNAPSLGDIVDQLAHEILRQCLAQDPANKLQLLDSAEFLTLSEVLVGASEANRRAIRGRLEPEAFATLLPRIAALADRVPDWSELTYLTARIADSGKDQDRALTYYQRVLPKLRAEQNAGLEGVVVGRIAALLQQQPAIAVAAAAQPLPAALDLAAEIGLVRDSGAEGSVVGQALATALEAQLIKARKDNRRISARYIYYAARQAAGMSLDSDSGALIHDGINVLAKQGAVADSVWPYVPGKYAEPPPADVAKAEHIRIAGERQLGSLDEIKRALKDNGPVVSGISVFQEMMAPAVAKTGVVPLPAKNSTIIGGHAVVIVGYDDAAKRFKFVNSWGPGWGDKGFGYLSYDYLEKYMSDTWTFRLAGS